MAKSDKSGFRTTFTAFFVVVAVIAVGVISYLMLRKFSAEDSAQTQQGPQTPGVVLDTAPSFAPSVDTSKNILKTDISTQPSDKYKTSADVAVSNSDTTKESTDFSLKFGIGASGNRVTSLQKFLSQFPEIYPEGLVTGYFGSLTEKAVKRFQNREDIEEAGVVGPETLQRLSELGLNLQEGSINTVTTESAPESAPAAPPAVEAFLKINSIDQSTLPENVVGGFDTLFARFRASGGDTAINRMVLVSDSIDADKNILLVKAHVVYDLTNWGRSPLFVTSPTFPMHVPQSGSSPEYWWWSVDLAPPRSVPNISYQISYVNGIGTVTTTTVPAVPNVWVSPKIIANDSSAIINVEAYCAHPARFRVGIMSVDAVSGSLFGETNITGKPVISGLSQPLYDRYIECIVMPDGSIRSSQSGT
ncbi:MAG: peptidoglycan-binding domain-containing protein [bacterium]|nr:peptidoglycan-binding domain-containing protein [bacterium]